MQQGQSLFMRELIDAKVEVSVSRAIMPVLERIDNLRQEVQQQIGSLRTEVREEMHEMRLEFSTRLIAVETALKIHESRREQVRTRFLDYIFKVAWLLASSVLSGLFAFLMLTASR
jgi:hypothetical protein